MNIENISYSSMQNFIIPLVLYLYFWLFHFNTILESLIRRLCNTIILYLWVMNTLFVRWRTVSTIFKCIYHFDFAILYTLIWYIIINVNIIYTVHSFETLFFINYILHCLPYTPTLWSLTRFISLLFTLLSLFPQTHPHATSCCCHLYNIHCYAIMQSCMYNWFYMYFIVWMITCAHVCHWAIYCIPLLYKYVTQHLAIFAL